MDATCGKFCGRFRKNKVFSVSQISPSVSTVISCTKVSTRSDYLRTRTAEEKDCQSALRCVANPDMCIEKYTEEVTGSSRIQETRASRLRLNVERGKRKPQSNIALPCIQLDKDMDIRLADPTPKIWNYKDPRQQKESRHCHHTI